MYNISDASPSSILGTGERRSTLAWRMGTQYTFRLHTCLIRRNFNYLAAVGP